MRGSSTLGIYSRCLCTASCTQLHNLYHKLSRSLPGQSRLRFKPLSTRASALRPKRRALELEESAENISERTHQSEI